MLLNIYYCSHTDEDALVLEFAFRKLGLDAAIQVVDDPDTIRALLLDEGNPVWQACPPAFFLDCGHPYDHQWQETIQLVRSHAIANASPLIVWHADILATSSTTEWQTDWGLGGLYPKPFAMEEMVDFIRARILQFQRCQILAA